MLRIFRRRDREVLCVEFVEAVTDYLEGVMDEGERNRFERHLLACPHCTRYLAQIRRTIALSGRLTTQDVDALAPEARAELLAAYREYRSGA
jgi:anti-sigma factor RsiW